MFLGRKSELNVLQQEFDKNSFSFSVIYGRRRVGKTTLIKEFIKGKAAIYFQATISNEKDNLENFSRSIGVYEGKGIETSYTFANFRSLFDNVTQLAKEKALVLVIDEFPYLARSFPEISSILQYYMDHVWKEISGLHIILAGSSMSFMEHQVLGYESPLYGRKTSQIKVLPFNFKETLDFFPHLNGVDVLTYYAITGGIPLYLSYMDPQKSVPENIINTFLNKNSGIFEEPYNLLQQELRNPASYNTILTAIAGGASKQNEIATKAGISTSLAAKQIDTLIELGIVEKRMPVGEGNNKLSVYYVKDGLFRFWYRFVAKNMSYIELELTQELLDYIIQFLPEFLSIVFEDISRQWVAQQMRNGDMHTIYGKLGSWWGTNKKTRRQEEIDICGLDISEENVLLGECKWKNEAVDLAVLKKLVQRGDDLFHWQNKEYIVFSKTGFTDGASEFAKVQGIKLIEFADMVDYFNKD
ncbi:MAG: ATP-binding protein [Streptococcaceae bacterium]|jgi:AAA+ ATPase superfamily predicted ATPase|nr:ATP-binding protein [Streptococcaceae bacterium]